MRPLFYLVFLLGLPLAHARAQTLSLTGMVTDEEKKPVLYATVSLLSNQDSTLVQYGITSESGSFSVKNIRQGAYLMQVAAFGYKTWMQPVQLNKDSVVLVRLDMQGVELNEVEITTEAIPLLIKKDTIEYNADAFKTRPDAVAEDLLKKLPGVEVDRAGNVKAQGENVSKVLVDGKEFFGNDPKVATKNLPADAVKKVQVYDKKSDESELTGIDDGSREKIVNLVLKDGKKAAILGDVTAGYGTGDHFQSAAKVYRFRQKTQFAALGMLNNINRFGFTFSDYLSFSGGLNSLSSGDGLGTLIGNNNIPVDYGQPVTGLVTSGAGGLNYTYEKEKDNRFNISYMGNGSEKKLDETMHSTNFLETGSYQRFDTTSENNRKYGHNLQLNWRRKIDTVQNIVVRANGAYASGNVRSLSRNYTGNEGSWTNQALYLGRSRNDQLEGNVSASYMHRLFGKWRLFKLGAEGALQQNHARIHDQNTITYPPSGFSFSQNPYQLNTNTVLNTFFRASALRTIGKGFYLEPGITAGLYNDRLDREQGFMLTAEQPLDSLSPRFKMQYLYTRPALTLKKSTAKTDFSLTARAEYGWQQNRLNGPVQDSKTYLYITPELSWEKEYKQQKRLGLYYSSSVTVPPSYQLLPVANGLNPLQVYTGNASLRPEYIHRANLRWWIFDQFSMTSFFAGLNGTYTHDKISFARLVNADLSQRFTMVNVPDDYYADANVDFSTPLRWLKVNISLNLTESWNRSISLVNNVQNINTSLTHSGTLALTNRKREKWDLRTGVSISYTDARYSVQQSLNNRYYRYGYFTDISFTPSPRFSLLASADVSDYRGSRFNGSVMVPLLKAEARFYFLKNNRGIFSVEAFDLLNKNTGIVRTSELNYLMETHSSIIRQYFLFSFKYKLSKFDPNRGITINVKGG